MARAKNMGDGWGFWYALAVLALATSACDSMTPAPHGHAATFGVDATLMQNTCGPQALTVASHMSFQARLAYDRAQATWSLVASGASASGEWIDAPPSFRISTSSYTMLRAADRRYGVAACVLYRFDQLEGNVSGLLPDLSVAAALDGSSVLDALDGTAALEPTDAGPTTFSATESIVYGVADGADCRDKIGAAPGQFIALPCQITYAMIGTAAPRN